MTSFDLSKKLRDTTKEESLEQLNAIPKETAIKHEVIELDDKRFAKVWEKLKSAEAKEYTQLIEKYRMPFIRKSLENLPDKFELTAKFTNVIGEFKEEKTVVRTFTKEEVAKSGHLYILGVSVSQNPTQNDPPYYTQYNTNSWEFVFGNDGKVKDISYVGYGSSQNVRTRPTLKEI